MEENTLSTRLNLFVNRILDPWGWAERQPTSARTDRAQRRDFFYYMLVMDAETKEAVGHLSDIGTGGFRLDTRNPIPSNKDFRLCLHLPKEVSDRPFMVFGARSRWCRADPLDPFTYNVGFQLIHFAPEDLEVFIRMMEKYGRDYEKKNIDLRYSNRW